MNLARLKAILTEELLAVADRAALDMEAKAIQLAPEGVSEPGLNKSIHGTGLRSGDLIKARLVCTAPHGTFVEHGTGPAVGHGKYMPPPEILRPWIARKLGLSGEALDKAAEAIRWAIYAHGTKPQPFMKPAYDSVKKGWKKRLQTGALRAARRIRAEARHAG